ncbi:MAG: CatB-related O-acetyltransferase [Candidatus Hydrogenedentales bacterium]|jgi:hypothetical protein
MGETVLRRLFNYLPPSIKSRCKSGRRRLAAIANVWGADEWRPDPRVTIGKFTYGIRRSSIPILTSGTRISIGSYCSIAPGVVFVVGRHRIENVSTFPFRAGFLEGGRSDDEEIHPESITIGHDVWVGSRSLIVASATVGHGAVIAAGSVVVKDVPPYAVVAGVPARVVKMRFDPERVQKLLEIAWWDWPDARIRANIDLFYGDPDEFIRRNTAPDA